MNMEKTPHKELIVFERGEVCRIRLDSRARWTLGRETPENTPDIPLRSAIAGRTHGEFVHVGNGWFYCDGGSLNGTFYNGKKLVSGRRVRPVRLHSGDVLRIDYSDLSTPDSRGVWMLFTTEQMLGEWASARMNKSDGEDEACR